MKTILKKKATDLLVVGTGSLLGDLVAHMMMHEPEFNVATITGGDPALLDEALARTTPEVILFCHGYPLDWSRTMEILKGIPEQEQVRMIVIRRDDNFLEVYEKEYIELTSKTDLFTLIQDR